MNFHIISLLPQMIQATLGEGLVGQGLRNNLFSVFYYNPRDEVYDPHKTVDDRPFGGGDGMCLMAEPLWQSLGKVKQRAPEARVIYLTPQGALLTEAKVQELAEEKDLVLICGRYGGVDQRFLNRASIEELSIGDYVLSGGELAAAVCIDAIARKIPGVLGKIESASSESFAEPGLEAPLFTRPREWQGASVPAVLLSGDHQKIAFFRRAVSLAVTLKKRPELKNQFRLEPKEFKKMKELLLNLSDSDKEILSLPADLAECLLRFQKEDSYE